MVTNALDLALSGMRAAELGITVTSHNIANVNTDGYTRQRVMLKTNPTLITRGGLVGGGVGVDRVERVSDRFVMGQVRAQYAEQSYFSQLETRLSDVEAVFNTVNDEGVSRALTDLFTSLSDVAAHPDDVSTRITAVGNAKVLAGQLNSTRSQLVEVAEENRTELRNSLTEVNTVLDELAMLNGRIAGNTTVKTTSISDLQDRRDTLLKTLSGHLGCSISVDNNDGMASVAVNGKSILLGSTATHLTLDNSGIYLEGESTPENLTGGDIGAMLQIRDTTLPAYLDDIDTLASTIVTSFNAVHKANYGLDGSTNLDLFQGTDAADFKVNSVIDADPNKLASSATGAPGDSGGVEALLALRTQPLINGGTLEQHYTSIVGAIGTETSSAQIQKQTSSDILSGLENRRDSVAGVSLDEEMTNLIRYQQSYNAAARVVNIINDLNQILMGLGR